MKVLSGLRALYLGKPFVTAATNKSEKEVLAELRARKPERCEIFFYEGLLEIHLLPPFPWANQARTIFKGGSQQGDAGLKISGKFEYELMFKIFLSLFLVMAAISGITSGSWILAMIVPAGALIVIAGALAIADLSNREQEKTIKLLLNDITQSPDP